SFRVEVQQAAFKDVVSNTKVDCIVSPANSFGLMDGGADWYISKLFGGPQKLIPVIQNSIDEEWCGEQNVNTTLLVNVDSLRDGKEDLPKYIAHTPSMRIPTTLSPKEDIVYKCTWAFLNAVRNHNRHNTLDRIETVLCSGFGTGTGRFPVEMCAKQMILACSNFLIA
ncbi:macro domain-like protein, partial [Basidiobolus meristosporus CBS 931.73]